MNNAEHNISEPLGFKIFWGRMPPTSVEVRAFGEGKTKVCLTVALCGNGFDEGGLCGKLCIPLKKSWLHPCKMQCISICALTYSVCPSKLTSSKYSVHVTGLILG